MEAVGRQTNAYGERRERVRERVRARGRVGAGKQNSLDRCSKMQQSKAIRMRVNLLMR